MFLCQGILQAGNINGRGGGRRMGQTSNLEKGSTQVKLIDEVHAR